MRFSLCRLSFSLFILFSAGISFSLEAVYKKTVCLNMLVKNQEATIRRCLESVKPLIDYWVIVDMGSTDGTVRIIREYLKEIPGEIHTIPFKSIEETYNVALRLAQSKADYVLFMSGEAYLQFDPLFQLPSLSQDVYCIDWHNQHDSGFRRQIIKTSLPWRWKVGYKGALDYLSCDVPCSSEVIGDIHYVIEDARTSSGSLMHGKKNLFSSEGCLDPKEVHETFLLAESYRKAGKKEKALEWYKKRVSMGQNGQELFWALLQTAHLQEELSYPSDDVIDAYYKAYICSPTSVEPVYCLAHFFNHIREYTLAYECIKAWAYIPRAENNVLGQPNKWMEDFGILLELSLSSLCIGKYQESLDTCEKLLAIRSLPGGMRDRVLDVQKLAADGLRKSHV